MSHATSGRHIKQNNDHLPSLDRFRKVFKSEQEKILGYLTDAANLYYGLSPRDVRVLAYYCAVEFKIIKCV